MNFSFTAKILGRIEDTKDLAVVAKWLKLGKLVLPRPCNSFSSFSMSNGRTTKKLKMHPSVANEAIALWEKGYKILEESKVQQTPPVKKFSDTLTKVADVLEPTNAKKAEYFRNATPYRNGRLLVVDFPTMGNALQSTIDKFAAAGKPSNVKTLYHGTELWRIPSIVKCGLKRGGRGGMIGRGIYLGPLVKARNYTDLIILEVKVVLGNCKELEAVELLEHNPDFDSMHLHAGVVPGVYKGFLKNEEWVVRSPAQVEISKLVCEEGFA